MSNFDPNSITLRSLFASVFRNLFKLLFFNTLVILGVVGVILYFPREYRSEAKLWIKIGRENTTIDPTAATGPTVSVQETDREDEIQSTIDVLRSRGVAAGAVEKLGAKVVLGEEPPPNSKRKSVKRSSQFIESLKGSLAWVKQIDPVSEDEEAIIEIQKNTAVEAERKSNVISISFDSKSPALSQAVVGALIEAHRERHAMIHHNDESKPFFDQQRAELEQQVAAASAALKEAKDRYGLASVDGQRQILENELLNLRNTKLAVLKDSQETAARRSALGDLVSLQPSRVTAEERVIPNTGRDNLWSQLYALQVQRMELESTLSDDHPRLVAIRRKEDEARRELGNSAPEERVETTERLSEIYESLTLSKALEEANSAGHEAALESLEREERSVRKRLSDLNQAEIEIRQLERELQLSENSFMSYAESVEDARVGDALTASTISNVSVAQEPSFQEKPVSPPKMVVAVLGVAAMFFGSIAVVAGSEMFRNLFLAGGKDEVVHTNELRDGQAIEDEAQVEELV